jgi:hypothetical protein
VKNGVSPSLLPEALPTDILLVVVNNRPHLKKQIVDSASECHLAKRVIALRLAGGLLTTKDAVRLALDGLGAVGSVLG